MGAQARRAGAGLARGDKFVAAVEEVSREIQDPAAKLRFLRQSLSRHQSLDRAVRYVPWLHRVVYRWADRKGDGTETALTTLGVPVRVISRRRMGSRVAAVAAAVALAALAGAGILRATRPSVAAPVLAAAVPTLPPVAESLPLLPAAVAPSAIWLVEKGADWELFSNGLRIDTTFAVTGEPRRFKVFEEGLGLKDEVYTKPVGIVFHTSESDIWPLEASFNESLRDSSQRLLRYLVRNRCYNYLIDRFGRVYRVVEEESKANHAGTSIWASGKDIYLNLNNSFLGVSFETRWEGGRALPITQAQLAAGRNLTEYLRQRWEIAGEMCVGHGLVSINPAKHLIGNHMDWSRGFPFAAFGLPDQYATVPPSVGLFGFGYDGDFLKVLGEPWPGVRRAEEGMAEEARRTGKSEEEVRRGRRALYDEWRQAQVRDEDEARVSVRADATARGARFTKGSGG